MTLGAVLCRDGYTSCKNTVQTHCDIDRLWKAGISLLNNPLEGVKIALAPMAGVTDLAFRTICREKGAELTYTEMVSSRGFSITM